jgi:hypothetical protein
MDSQTIDRKITELLDDPLVSLMIRADGVDRSQLAVQLRRIGRPDLQRRLRDNPPQRVFARIFAASCGACAP